MFSLGIIPARKGSKRIPHKNMAELGGRPLIDWTFESALKSTLDDLIVSTDDDAVKRLACQRGVPVMCRPPELAGDAVHASKIVLDILQRVPGKQPDVVCMLLPTTPFRTAQHIDEALSLINNTDCHSVVGVKMLPFPAIRLRHIDQKNGDLRPLMDNVDLSINSQQCESLYLVNGAIFVAEAAAIMWWGPFHIIGATAPYLMDEMAGLDIDTPEDLQRARKRLKA